VLSHRGARFDGIGHALPRIRDLELRFAGAGVSRGAPSTYAFTVPNIDEPLFDGERAPPQ
jgi:hypothetical protein